MEPTKFKRNVLVLLSVFLLVAILAVVFNQLNKSRLDVSSEEGALLSIAFEQGGEFIDIGTTRAKYSTNYRGVAYIKASKDGKSTIKTVSLAHRQTVTDTLGLLNIKPMIRSAYGSLSNIHPEGGLFYGVNPVTKSIDISSLDNTKRQTTNYLGLPFIKKIFWTDSENFIYNTFGLGVGRVIKGEAKTITHPSNANLQFDDFTKYPGKPLFLYGDHTIFLQHSAGLKQVDTVSSSGASGLFSDENYLYFTLLHFDPAEEEGDVLSPTSLSLAIYNYSGERAYSFEVADPEDVVSVVDLDSENRFLLLGKQKMLVIDKQVGLVEGVSHYFLHAKDMVKVNDKIYLLTPDGLWEYDTNGSKEYRLVSDFPSDEEYVANSLSPSQENDSLYLSTALSDSALRDPQRSAAASIYKVDLSN